MSPDELRERLAGLKANGWSVKTQWYDGTWAGVLYADMPSDVLEVLDEVPGLSADSAKLAALEAALDGLRAALVEEVAKAERAAASEVDRSLDEALELGAADAYGEAIQRLDVARSAIPPDTDDLNEVTDAKEV